MRAPNQLRKNLRIAGALAGVIGTVAAGAPGCGSGDQEKVVTPQTIAKLDAKMPVAEKVAQRRLKQQAVRSANFVLQKMATGDLPDPKNYQNSAEYNPESETILIKSTGIRPNQDTILSKITDFGLLFKVGESNPIRKTVESGTVQDITRAINANKGNSVTLKAMDANSDEGYSPLSSGDAEGLWFTPYGVISRADAVTIADTYGSFNNMIRESQAVSPGPVRKAEEIRDLELQANTVLINATNVLAQDYAK